MCVDGGVVLQHNGVIPAWGRGSRYQDASGVGTYVTGALPAISKSANLLDGQGRFFRRTRPQYETLPASYFDSVKSNLTISNPSTASILITNVMQIVERLVMVYPMILMQCKLL